MTPEFKSELAEHFSDAQIPELGAALAVASGWQRSSKPSASAQIAGRPTLHRCSDHTEPRMQLWQKIFSAVALLFVVLVGIGVVRYNNLEVLGSNMHPALPVGESFTVQPGKTPVANDIIVFDAPQRVGSATGGLLSRLVAVGGQEVSFAGGHLFIDGALIDEPFLWEELSTEPRALIPGCEQEVLLGDRCEIPDGFGFVMGDNRRGSNDSRVYGPIDLSTVQAVVVDPPWWLFTGLLP